MEVNQTYFDFAENDYNFLKDAYKSGFKANQMCALSQEICEKYMKHIIDTYINVLDFPSESQELLNKRKMDILKSHSLHKLAYFIDDFSKVNYSDDVKSEMFSIDGMYFSVRYPGEDSYFVRDADIEKAFNAATSCREATVDIISRFNQLNIEDKQTNSAVLSRKHGR
jgi:hypothetical protein